MYFIHPVRYAWEDIDDGDLFTFRPPPDKQDPTIPVIWKKQSSVMAIVEWAWQNQDAVGMEVDVGWESNVYPAFNLESLLS